MLRSEMVGLRALSNWGRWGSDDERGTVNFITPEVIVQAAREVRKGTAITCAIPIDRDGPSYPTRIPNVRMMSVLNLASGNGDMLVNDDTIVMPLQGSTQWDSLAHIGYAGVYYNGVTPAQITAERGATRNSIFLLGESLSTRGVLLDMVRYFGVEPAGHLPPSYAITVADIEGCLAAQGVTVRSGDALLVRTGWTNLWYRERQDPWQYARTNPGLSVKTLEWIYDREIACVAVDNITVEVQPGEVAGYPLPLHEIAIRDMGLTIGEVFDFRHLADDCAQDGRYTCLFVGPPLRFRGALGSPLNPLAIK